MLRLVGSIGGEGADGSVAFSGSRHVVAGNELFDSGRRQWELLLCVCGYYFWVVDYWEYSTARISGRVRFGGFPDRVFSTWMHVISDFEIDL